MKNILVQMILIALAAKFGLAQQASPEKHVKDIRAAQPRNVILQSSLCQDVRSSGHSEDDVRQVDSSTLETDLSALMQKSDEVVLGGAFTNEARVLSPSGKDVVQYFDVKVLRTWKGSHKVGDLLTFGVPWGGINCELKPQKGSSSVGFYTLSGGADWLGLNSGGPWVLFLRYSQGAEAELISGLRLTGGDGLQGLFEVDYPRPDNDCYGTTPVSIERCNAILDSSHEKISVRYQLDPLKKQYDTMPISIFLKEVQSLADSLSAMAPQSNTGK